MKVKRSASTPPLVFAYSNILDLSGMDGLIQISDSFFSPPADGGNIKTFTPSLIPGAKFNLTYNTNLRIGHNRFNFLAFFEPETAAAITLLVKITVVRCAVLVSAPVAAL